MTISYYCIVAVIVIACSVFGALLGIVFFPQRKEPSDDQD